MLVFLFDIFYLALLLLIVGLPLAALAAWLPLLTLPVWAWWGLAPVWLVIHVCGMSLVAVGLNWVIPRLKPGRYSYPFHAQSLSWLLRFAIQRVFNLPIWANLLCSFAALRWCVLRAQGACVAWNMQTASNILITDPKLVHVEKGSMLALGTVIVGHYIENEQLVLAPVRIGQGVQLMGEVTLMPGVCIGAGSTIGPGTKVLADVEVGEDVFIGLGCVIQPGVRIADNVVIGHRAEIGAGAVIEEGAVIRPGARVPKGVVIAEGTRH